MTGAGGAAGGAAGTREGGGGSVDSWGRVKRRKTLRQVWVFLVTLATVADGGGAVMAHGGSQIARLSGGLAVDWTVE